MSISKIIHEKLSFDYQKEMPLPSSKIAKKNKNLSQDRKAVDTSSAIRVALL
jgi:hypothetical protein